ncbi:hypothetical protein HPB49_001337 [Dermacentor silvarum]|uniref:Uncharacterized protein n=1 Tax=Dermacentor silvarum TaxID=543639 RepID=A0ACB8D9N5_DERSI|nr:hypothetical protein HPB49_001337 [Dermacentor silvarum]
MSLARGYDPESMQVVELQPAKKAVFDEATEYVIRKKLEEQQLVAETRASSKQQEALRGGDAMNGHVTTSTLGKTLPPKRWKPKVVPKFGTEDPVAVVKPRGILNLSNFKGSNQIGEAMYAAAGVPSSTQALTIWPAWDQNIIIVGIRDAQFIRNVLAVESLRIGSRLQVVQVYLKMTDNTRHAPVVGVRKLGQSNAAAITFEGRKVPFNVFYCGEAVPVRLYRKTTPACTLCGTVGHRVDVFPNPRDYRCRACGSVTPEEGHECQPRCLVCGDPHLTGSADCTWKYRKGAGAGREPGGGKSSNKRQARGARQDSGPGTDLREAVVQLTIIKLQEPELEPGQRKPRAASLGTKATWRLLRCLIEPTKSRGEQQRNLKRALHGFAGTDEQLVAALTSKYICTMKDNEPVREYEATPNVPNQTVRSGGEPRPNASSSYRMASNTSVVEGMEINPEEASAQAGSKS